MFNMAQRVYISQGSWHSALPSLSLVTQLPFLFGQISTKRVPRILTSATRSTEASSSLTFWQLQNECIPEAAPIISSLLVFQSWAHGWQRQLRNYCGSGGDTGGIYYLGGSAMWLRHPRQWSLRYDLAWVSGCTFSRSLCAC